MKEIYVPRQPKSILCPMCKNGIGAFKSISLAKAAKLKRDEVPICMTCYVKWGAAKLGSIEEAMFIEVYRRIYAR